LYDYLTVYNPPSAHPESHSSIIMPRKPIITNDDSEDEYESSQCEVEPISKSKKRSKKAQNESDEEEEEEEEEEEVPISKKRKIDRSKASEQTATRSAKGRNRESSGNVHTNAEGDKYIELGKKRRATVRAFKGALLLDIREFYEQGGEEKPGKKGISLSLEQWESLKSHMDTIDSLLSKAKK